MDFHALCECKLEEINENTYSVGSENEYVGDLVYCSVLGEWSLRLLPNILVSHEYINKIWTCLIEELTTDKMGV